MNRQTHHFFLALPIPKEMAIQVVRIVKKENADLAFKTWVEPEDYHITLHFLGYASKEQLLKLNHVLPHLVGNWKSFELEITHFGSFGEAQAPRILWVGVREESSLFSFQYEIGTICKQAGFELERRPYRPHITVARKWDREDPFSLARLASEINKTKCNWKWQVKEVLLYQTCIDRLPKYEAIYRYPLQ